MTQTFLQGFWQRLQNYQCSQRCKRMAPVLNTSKRDFIEKLGFKLRSTGNNAQLSYAVATIVAVDWAIEFPQPMPPSVHVITALSSLCL